MNNEQLTMNNDNGDAGRNVSADSGVKVSVFKRIRGLLIPGFITALSRDLIPD